MAEQKQYEASAKKLRQAREKGDIPKSSLLTQGVVIAGGCITILTMFSSVWVRIPSLVQYCFVEGFQEPQRVAWLIGIEGAKVVFGFFAVVITLAVFVELVQVGVMWRPQLALPDLNRLNPVSGMSKIFGGIKKILFDFIKAGVVVGLAWWVFRDAASLGLESVWNVTGAAQDAWGLVEKIIRVSLGIFGVFAAIEFFKTRSEYRKKHSMSREDMRQENKDEDGNPEVKGHRRHLHRAMIMQDLVTRVRKSKMIVVAKRD
jgi:flagellar biosynthesis protein FlhB